MTLEGGSLSHLYHDLLVRLDRFLLDDCELTQHIELAKCIHAAWMRLKNWGIDIGEEKGKVLERLLDLSPQTAGIVRSRLVSLSIITNEIEASTRNIGDKPSEELSQLVNDALRASANLARLARRVIRLFEGQDMAVSVMTAANSLERTESEEVPNRASFTRESSQLTVNEQGKGGIREVFPRVAQEISSPMSPPSGDVQHKPNKPSSSSTMFGAFQSLTGDRIRSPTSGPTGIEIPRSLAVPVPGNYIENGRLYHGFRRGIYMYPCDEPEKDRMDIYHKLFLVARREQLHQAPIPPNWEPRILDLGCGTGIWAIDMADRYLNAEVLGLDLVNIQQDKIPPNLRFRVPCDYESPWSLGEDSWCLIHLRMACGSVSSWPELYQKIFTHLRPGSGWIEQVEIDLRPQCDDHTLPQGSPITQWYNYLADATHRVSRPIAYQYNTRQMLQAAGFIDIQEIVIRAPYNSWPNDPHQKEIGRWYNLGISEGLEAMSVAPFIRVNQWNWNKHVKPLIEAVRAQICDKKIHAYNNIYIWTARRPQQ